MFDSIKTAQEAVDLLADVVKDVGADHVYPFKRAEDGRILESCRYAQPTEGGVLEPMCIVGYAGYKTGDLERLHRGEGTNIGSLITDHYYRDLDPVGKVLLAAQEKQDGGGTWGEALEAAKVQAHLIANPDVHVVRVETHV